MTKQSKKQIQNQAQEGRSMVEMLGVLAIIGVISIGGIAGYRMAMNRYQANQIANEINLMRADAKMKVAQRAEELLLGDPYDGDNGHLKFNATYGVEVGFEEIETETSGETEKGYSFTLSNIPAGVCKPLVTLLDSMDTAVLEINGGDETAGNECSKEENKIEIAFSTKDIGGERKCNPDKCEGKCTEAGKCEPCPEEMPWNGSACACPNDKHWNGNACVGCSGGKWDEGSNDCVCPEESHLKGDECITCPTEALWSDEADDCACTDTDRYWNGHRCVGCPSDGGTWDNEAKTCTCSGGREWNMDTGECVCSDYYNRKYWDSNTSRCESCKSNEVWNEVDKKCEVPESYCRTNADCNKNGKNGYFCYTSSPKSCYIEFEDGGRYNSGKCELVSSYLKKKAKIGDTTYYGTTINMPWWSACRICAARKGENDEICKSGTSGTTGTTTEPSFMVGYEMLQCADKIDVNNQKTGYCHATSVGHTRSADDNISERVKDLREMWGCDRESTNCNGYLLLRDSYDSCGVYYVSLRNSNISYYNRNYSNSALCE